MEEKDNTKIKKGLSWCLTLPGLRNSQAPLERDMLHPVTFPFHINAPVASIDNRANVNLPKRVLIHPVA